MKKLFIASILIAAFIITGLVYHKKIVFAVTFLTMRQYQALSDEELVERIEEVEDDTDAPDRKILLAEHAWRTKKAHYFFLTGFILSLLAFLELTRRVIYYRVPQSERDEQLWAQTGGVAPALRTDPVDATGALIPGSSNQQEAINLLGEPERRASTPGVETWTFVIPLEKAQDLIPEKILEFELLNMRDANQNQETNSPEPAKSLFVTLVVTFKGNLVHDVRVDTITESKETGRTL